MSLFVRSVECFFANKLLPKLPNPSVYTVYVLHDCISIYFLMLLHVYSSTCLCSNFFFAITHSCPQSLLCESTEKKTVFVKVILFSFMLLFCRRFLSIKTIIANTMFQTICYHPEESQIVTSGTDRKVRDFSSVQSQYMLCDDTTYVMMLVFTYIV